MRKICSFNIFHLIRYRKYWISEFFFFFYSVFYVPAFQTQGWVSTWTAGLSFKLLPPLCPSWLVLPCPSHLHCRHLPSTASLGVNESSCTAVEKRSKGLKETLWGSLEEVQGIQVLCKCAIKMREGKKKIITWRWGCCFYSQCGLIIRVRMSCNEFKASRICCSLCYCFYLLLD